MRRIWAKIGQRPIAVSTHKYQWLYLYGFVRPVTGEVEWWVANRVNVPVYQSILDAFATARGAGSDKTVILVVDNAGWHVSKKLNVPEGIRFCFLPPYSPELQPAERLWPLVDEAVANRRFDTLDDLTVALDDRCSALADMPAILSANSRFHWWPSESISRNPYHPDARGKRQHC